MTGSKVHKPLEWVCEKRGTSYVIRVCFRLFNGLNGYDHYVEMSSTEDELYRFGAEVIVDRAVFKIEDQIKSELYAALCNDREMLSNAWLHDRCSRAEQREWEANKRVTELEQKTAQYIRLMREVAGES